MGVVAIALSGPDSASAQGSTTTTAPTADITGASSEATTPADTDETDPAQPAPGEPDADETPGTPDDATGQDDTSADGEPYAARKQAAPRIRAAKATPRSIFLGGRKKAVFRFELGGTSARKLLLKVVNVKSGKVRKRKRLGSVAPGQQQRVVWDGKKSGGGFASEGKYAFRVFAGGERAKVSKDSSSQRFGFYGHRFPLLGRHTYGDGFGAGRGHQGQDVFAKCGTRLVAARGGRVQTKAFQSSAGYYVVIDGRGTGQDYVYMHMERRDRPREGSWVRTGQLIGYQSDTGNASGCHLHFELWGKPGWYEGGSPKPPTKALKRWDSWS